MEPDTTLARSPAGAAQRAAGDRAGADWTNDPLVTEVLEKLGGTSPRFLARAPGRLDVMGGLAEYTGCLTLSKPIADHVCVGVQRQSEPYVAIGFARSVGSDGARPTVVPLSDLVNADGTPVDAQTGRQVVSSEGTHRARCVLGAIVELVRSRILPKLDSGLSLMVGSTLDALIDAGRDAALAGATMGAVAQACGVTLDAAKAAAACQRVENHWLDAPVGAGDAVCVLLGEAGTLAQIQCEPCAVTGSIRLPEAISLVGIDCGALHKDAKLRYARARTATFMGCMLIDRIVQHDGAGHLQWNGRLSRISVNDYVERFRDRLPTKLGGGEFLDRFPETVDDLTQIDPDFIYKIRSRTEHHIYEHARVCQFVEGLSRAIRTGDERTLSEVGELMHASHWSYGQRCGLGSIQTDLLVNLIRKHGAGAGILGARITGRGCGGTVAVLMRTGDKTDEAVEKAAAEYRSKTGNETTMLRGSSPGMLVGGLRQV